MQERNMATENEPRDIDRVWDLMRTIGYTMLVTRDGETLRGRPMTAYVERSEGAVYFLTDARAHKDEEIVQSPAVNLSFADIGSQKYIWIKGTAVVSNDRGKIRQLFSTPARAWWNDADDPNIRVLKITPEEAEFWDSPGKLVAYTKMAAAVVSGTRPEIGDKRKVAM
jgi:general stress protein 26